MVLTIGFMLNSDYNHFIHFTITVVAACTVFLEEDVILEKYWEERAANDSS
jgi:hypothetical protein